MYGFKILKLGVEQQRIDVLVKNGLLLFNQSNYTVMKENYPSLAAKFITSNLDAYLVDVSNYSVSSVEMFEVLKTLAKMINKQNT